jgi:hypothetical protein
MTRAGARKIAARMLADGSADTETPIKFTLRRRRSPQGAIPAGRPGRNAARRTNATRLGDLQPVPR